MCRTKTAGGRRCPCTNTGYRSAQRKAKNASDQALDSIRKMLNDAQPPTVEQLKPLLEAPLKPESPQTPSAAPFPFVFTDQSFLPENLPETVSVIKRAWETRTHLPPHHPDIQHLEHALLRVGEAVEKEAENRVGFTVEDMQKENAEWLNNAEDDYHTLETARGEAWENHKTLSQPLEDELGDIPYSGTAEKEKRRQVYSKLDELSSRYRKTVDALEAEHPQGMWWERRLGYPGGEVYPPPVHAKLVALTEEYLRVVEQVRPLGGTIEYTVVQDEVSEYVEMRMARVQQVYPSDWITASNEEGGLTVAFFASGAPTAYTTRATPKYLTSTDDISYAVKPPGLTSEERAQLAEQGWTEIATADDIPEGFPIGYSPSRFGESRWFRPETETHIPNRDEIRRAYGDYYEYMEPDHSIFIPPTSKNPGNDWRDVTPTPPAKTPQGHPIFVWERIKRRTTENPLAFGDYITLAQHPYTTDYHPDDYGTQLGSLFSDTIHEFGHRCEHVVPLIRHMEAAFYDRRTRLPTGEREPFVTQTFGALGDTKTRPDTFVTPYIGRDYRSEGQRSWWTDLRDTQFFEVFTVGVESLFGGSYGGMFGLNRHDDDAEHRHATLGILTTA